VVGEWQWLGGSFEGRWKARFKAVILVLKWPFGDVYLWSYDWFFLFLLQHGVMVISALRSRIRWFVVGEWQWLGGSFWGRWKARFKAVILVLKWRRGDEYSLSCEGFYFCMATWGDGDLNIAVAHSMVRGGGVAVAGWQFWGSLESAFKCGHFGAKMTLWRCVFIELWGGCLFLLQHGVMVRF
jgi:hypothetical protein